MAPHSSTLAWKIPWTKGPGRLHAVHEIAKSWTRLSDFTFTFHFRALEKEMATHSRVLTWRIPGTGEPGGRPSMGSHRVGHDWNDLAAAAAVVADTSVWTAPLLGVAVRHIFCGLFFFFSSRLCCPLRFQNSPTDWLVREFPVVWKLLLHVSLPEMGLRP